MTENLTPSELSCVRCQYYELAVGVVQRGNKRLCDDIYDAELMLCHKALDTVVMTFSITYKLIRDDSAHLAVYLEKLRQPEVSRYLRAIVSLFERV